MKKNFLQILTLCLCIVLLVITIIQGMRLVEYRNWMEYRIDNLEQSVNGQTQRIADQVSRDLEEAGKTVADYTLEPVGIDPENRALLVDVSVTLKEWYEETEVTLLVETALEEVPLPMIAAGDGVFTGRLSVPLEGTCELSLYARISGGGRMEREYLGAWGDFSMLLPLQASGGGWSGPDYYDGAVHSDFYITLQGKDGEKVSVNNPEFRVYRNGELVQTLKAMYSISLSDDYSSSYTVSVGPEGWSVECDEDDVIVIRFRCEDEFGLGYDFLFMNWTIEGEIINDSNMMLFWPE